MRVERLTKLPNRGGAPGRIRTCDPSLRGECSIQLSYGSESATARWRVAQSTSFCKPASWTRLSGTS